MKINDLKQFIKNCVEKNVHVPPLVVGTMGVGKSQIMKQVANELGIQLIDLRLAQQESGDLIGLPFKNGDNSTHWARPEWWPKEGTRGILFLDEINRAPNDVRQAVFQLVLDRRLHTHVLPEGWFVAAAINPDNGNYQVETLDPAMCRRFCTIVVDPDVDVWLNWAKIHVSDNVSEFVNTNRALLFLPEEIKVEVKPTPDSYRMLDELLKAGVIPIGNQAEVFRGLIGNNASIAFIKWMDKNYERPISGHQVLTELQKHLPKIKKQRNDENYVTIQDLAAILSDDKKIPKDNSIEHKNLIEYTIMLPKESFTALISKLTTNARTCLLKDARVSKLLLDTIGNEVK